MQSAAFAVWGFSLLSGEEHCQSFLFGGLPFIRSHNEANQGNRQPQDNAVQAEGGPVQGFCEGGSPFGGGENPQALF